MFSSKVPPSVLKNEEIVAYNKWKRGVTKNLNILDEDDLIITTKKEKNSELPYFHGPKFNTPKKSRKAGFQGKKRIRKNARVSFFLRIKLREELSLLKKIYPKKIYRKAPPTPINSEQDLLNQKSQPFKRITLKTKSNTEFHYHSQEMEARYRESHKGEGVSLDEIRWFSYYKPNKMKIEKERNEIIQREIRRKLISVDPIEDWIMKPKTFFTQDKETTRQSRKSCCRHFILRNLNDRFKSQTSVSSFFSLLTQYVDCYKTVIQQNKHSFEQRESLVDLNETQMQDFLRPLCSEEEIRTLDCSDLWKIRKYVIPIFTSKLEGKKNFLDTRYNTRKEIKYFGERMHVRTYYDMFPIKCSFKKRIRRDGDLFKKDYITIPRKIIDLILSYYFKKRRPSESERIGIARFFFRSLHRVRNKLGFVNSSFYYLNSLNFSKNRRLTIRYSNIHRIPMKILHFQEKIIIRSHKENSEDKRIYPQDLCYLFGSVKKLRKLKINEFSDFRTRSNVGYRRLINTFNKVFRDNNNNINNNNNNFSFIHPIFKPLKSFKKLVINESCFFTNPNRSYKFIFLNSFFSSTLVELKIRFFIHARKLGLRKVHLFSPKYLQRLRTLLLNFGSRNLKNLKILVFDYIEMKYAIHLESFSSRCEFRVHELVRYKEKEDKNDDNNLRRINRNGNFRDDMLTYFYKKEKKKHVVGRLVLYRVFRDLSILKVDERSLRCEFCKKPDNNFGNDLKVCRGCHKVYYCDLKCQKMDWVKHKIRCRKVYSSNSKVRK